MKKALILLFVPVTFIACKKKYTCECISSIEPTLEYTIEAKSKEEAAENCPPEIVIAVYSCKIK